MWHELCKEDSDMAQYIFCESPETGRAKRKHFGIISSLLAKDLKPKRILGYLKAIELTII
jgi:hypothetical protein